MVGKFDEGLEEGIASFFFFNYFCPALLSPCDFGLWEGQVPPYALRGLILLSKVFFFVLFLYYCLEEICLFLSIDDFLTIFFFSFLPFPSPPKGA